MPWPDTYHGTETEVTNLQISLRDFISSQIFLKADPGSAHLFSQKMDNGPPILKLPDELLLNIFNVFIRDRTDFSSPSGRQWPRTILALCLTCKDFNRLATPLLVYRWSNLNRYTTWEPLAAFVKHLVERPDHRKAVRELAIRNSRDDEPELHSLHNDGYINFTEYGSEMSAYLNEETFRFPDAPNSISVAFTAVLLGMVPQLEVLEICWRFENYQLSRLLFPVNSHFQGILGSQESCRHLRKLIISPDNDTLSIPIGLLSQFFLLPTLRAFYGYNMVLETEITEITKRKSPVETVAFMNSDLSSTGVLNTLNTFANLRKIIIVLDAYCGQSTFTSSAIVQAACVHGRTLEELTIDIYWSSLTHNDDGDPDDDSGLLGMHMAFPSLRMLNIGLEVIFGRSEKDVPLSLIGRLPESLEELQINSYNIPNPFREICVMFEEFLKNANAPDKRYRMFKRLDLTQLPGISTNLALAEGRELLKAACLKADVQLRTDRSSTTYMFGWVKHED